MKSFVFPVVLTAVSSPALANHFSVQKGAPTFDHEFSLQRYVNQLSHYQPETIALRERLQQTIVYYQKVHILKTINKPNYTVDCIPFAEQPTLIDRPKIAQSLLDQVEKNARVNLALLEAMGTSFEVNTAVECPFGSIGLMRPTQLMLTSDVVNAKSLPHMSAPHASGYTWEQGVSPLGDIIYIDTPVANQAYFKGPQNQYVTPNSPTDHSLNQFWLTNRPGSNDTYSVEFGIIASAYFTNFPTTSIFVFASIDNYGDNSCYNLTCPNFIQSPGVPPFGVPITDKSTDYIFQVKHVKTHGFLPGYYLTLITHNQLSGKQASTLLGYYPQSLYPANDLPEAFSAGAEVFARSANNGTLMYGNYANPYAGYAGPKEIARFTQNGNLFPYSTSTGPAPYGLIWNLGQA